jgi:hypothetical protein
LFSCSTVSCVKVRVCVHVFRNLNKIPSPHMRTHMKRDAYACAYDYATCTRAHAHARTGPHE